MDAARAKVKNAPIDRIRDLLRRGRSVIVVDAQQVAILKRRNRGDSIAFGFNLGSVRKRLMANRKRLRDEAAVQQDRVLGVQRRGGSGPLVPAFAGLGSITSGGAVFYQTSS
jgi:hypothetical protein